MMKAMRSKISNEIFNVGSQKSIQIKKVAKIFSRKMTYIPKRSGDPRHSFADIKKIKKKLNWKPYISIKKGIGILLKKK